MNTKWQIIRKKKRGKRESKRKGLRERDEAVKTRKDRVKRE